MQWLLMRARNAAAKDWLKPGVLHPIESSKIHPPPLDGKNGAVNLETYAQRKQ